MIRVFYPTANFSVVDPCRMMRTKGFAEGLTLGAYSTDRACMACAGQYQRNLLYRANPRRSRRSSDAPAYGVATLPCRAFSSMPGGTSAFGDGD